MRELPAGTVTLLFTDIEGSTRMLQNIGGRYASLLETCRSLLRAAFLEFDGHEVDTQGDAFFVAFARATDAVAAAVAAQRALFTQAWPDSMMVRVRIGLHTGEPQLTSEGYVGLDVHHAARIMSAGHGGQVSLSQTTRDLVERSLPEGVSLLDMGTHRLKDLQQPGQIFQLEIMGLPTDFPPLKTLDNSLNNLPIQSTPFIGREKEVNAVQQLLLRKDVRLVTLTGPGGVGKTRLALQIAAELSEHFTDGTWLVSLAPISDPDLVIPAITQILGLREVQDQSSLEQLKTFLRAKKTLLLLDNFEQVMSAAPHVAELLTRSARDVPARQQTLRKTIQWSYDLLSTQEQSVFRLLSIFVGGCTLQANEAIAVDFVDDTTSILDVVASLIDKNLVQQTGEVIRLTMLETIHEYGLEMLSISGEMETAQQAHAAYYLKLAQEAAPQLKGPQQAEWFERLEQEHGNLRALMEWSLEPTHTGPHLEMAFQLGEALREFWWVRGFDSEGRNFLEQVLARSEGVRASVRARALSAVADSPSGMSDPIRLEALWQESLALYRELGDTRGIAWPLSGLAGLARMKENNIAAACSMLEESLLLYRKVGDKDDIAWSLFALYSLPCGFLLLKGIRKLYILRSRKAWESSGNWATRMGSLWPHGLQDG